MSDAVLPVVIAIAGDPGGANAVAPVIELLRHEGRVEVRALAYVQAIELWRKRGLSFVELNGPVSDTSVRGLLSVSGSALLLTATSHNSFELEKQFISIAKKIGLPSLVVLDFWSNYARRFSGVCGRLEHMPDRIAAMDEMAVAQSIDDGIDPSSLVVTGQPAFDELIISKSRFTEAQRNAIRVSLDVKPDELLVVFASQPISEVLGKDSSNAMYPGYDEQIVLRQLAKALDQIAHESKRKISLAVKTHPREIIGWLSEIKVGFIRVTLVTNGDSRDLIQSAELVTGMTTVLLVEACYLGCLTVSLQPGLILPDPLPTNRLGISRPVYVEEQMKPVLEGMLLDEATRTEARKRLANFRPSGNASLKVAELAYEMIGMESDREGGLCGTACD